MSLPTLKPITCPSCGSSRFERDNEGNLICSACGTKFASPREQIVCPACGTYNPADANVCMNCGLTLGKICPACNHLNPPGTENCLECGTPLDTLSSLATRVGEGKRRSQALREQQLVRQKGDDLAYMERERERIDAEEQARQLQLARQRAEARRQQSNLIAISVVVLLVIFVGIAVISLLMAVPR